jgi:hypothetical protein
MAASGAERTLIFYKQWIPEISRASADVLSKAEEAILGFGKVKVRPAGCLPEWLM